MHTRTITTMVNSLKVITTAMLFAASTTSSLTINTSPQTTIATNSWGVSSSVTSIDDDMPGSYSIHVENNERFFRFRHIPLHHHIISTSSHIVTSSQIYSKKITAEAVPGVLDCPVIEKKRIEDIISERKHSGSEAWKVRIYNDGMNTREFVAKCLVQITSLTENAAYDTMMLAHQNGIAVVGKYAFEIAEMYHSGLTDQGIVSDLVPEVGDSDNEDQ